VNSTLHIVGNEGIDRPLSSTWVFEAYTLARRKVLELAQRTAASSCSVLILGPTGVGKEVLANDVHRHSGRENGPFITVNCAAIAPALFESAFFGHIRGAFTGATTDKLGFVEMAHGGTLFLDEVGELPLDVQAKLLRFLAQGTYWPVGAHAERHVDVRIIAATHRQLDELKGQSFREDLFYRLSVVVLRIPALDKNDVAGIARSIARDVMVQRDKSLSDGDIDSLAFHCALHEWPGGARELRNMIDRTLVLWDEQTSFDEHCAETLGIESTGVSSGVRLRASGVSAARDLENLLFLAIAAECGDVRELARRTDRTAQAVYVRLRRLGLEPQHLGETEALLDATEKLRQRIVPELSWIRSILGL
jgi:DNA-binding NtrC family response regulator